MEFWVRQATIVRLWLVFLTALTAIAVFRIVRVVTWLRRPADSVLWERCSIDVQSVRRASHLVVLLSGMMVTFAGFPLFNECFSEGKVTGGYCIFETADHLTFLLGVGFSVAAFLFFLSSAFERALRKKNTQA